MGAVGEVRIKDSTDYAQSVLEITTFLNLCFQHLLHCCKYYPAGPKPDQSSNSVSYKQLTARLKYNEFGIAQHLDKNIVKENACTYVHIPALAFKMDCSKHFLLQNLSIFSMKCQVSSLTCFTQPQGTETKYDYLVIFDYLEIKQKVTNCTNCTNSL